MAIPEEDSCSTYINASHSPNSYRWRIGEEIEQCFNISPIAAETKKIKPENSVDKDQAGTPRVERTSGKTGARGNDTGSITGRGDKK